MDFLNTDPFKYIVIGEFLGGNMPWHFGKNYNGINNCSMCSLNELYWKGLGEYMYSSDDNYKRPVYCCISCMKSINPLHDCIF
jgi:hypothetical protein